MKRSSRLAAIARVQQHREQHQRLILLEARQQLDKQQALLKQLEDYEHFHQLRKRKRRPADQKTFKRIREAYEAAL